jgi:hypothetical protein
MAGNYILLNCKSSMRHGRTLLASAVGAALAGGGSEARTSIVMRENDILVLEGA